MVFISYNPLLLLFFYALVHVHTQPSICSQGCLSCLYSQLKCTACDQGYQLTFLGRCLKTDGRYNCALFGNRQSQCLSCKPTYRLQNGTCFKDYSGCLQWKNGSCSVCGYSTNLTGGRCEGILNCAKYDSACLFCMKGYIFNSNRCFYVQRDCAKVDVTSGACEFCAPGLTLVGFSCLNTQSKIRNCDIYDQKGCIFCKSGFGLKQQKCVPIPNCPSLQFVNSSYQCSDLPFGCKQMDQSLTLCSNCFQNFKLEGGNCTAVLPQKCLEIGRNGACLKCQDRYFANQYRCELVSKYCKEYSGGGKCLSCAYDYFKNDSGVCTDPYCLTPTLFACLKCRQLYIYDEVSSRCLMKDPHCLSPTQTTCLSCSEGYYASKDICLILPSNCRRASKVGECLKCEDNYFMEFDQCYSINKTISNCLRYDPYSYVSRCIECEVGFMVVLDKCIEIPPFCVLTLSNGKCVMCSSGFALTPASACAPLNQNNADWQCVLKQNGKCIRCASGSVLGVNDKCYQLADACTKRDEDGICLYCGEAAVLSRRACLAVGYIDQNCKTYQGALCRQCYGGYYLGDNACKLPNSDCKAFSPSNGGCTACYPGYTLTNRQCVVMTKIANCQAYDGKGKCLKCSRFYYLSSGNECLQVNSLCSFYNQYTGECRACYSGFDLKNGSCIKKQVASWYDPTKQALVTVQICSQYDSKSGNCAKCIVGYFLKGGKCLNYGSAADADPKCKTYLNRSHCLQCYPGYISILGQCRGVDLLCRTVDGTNGECTSCYQGYNLAFGRCTMEGRMQVDPCAEMQGERCAKCSQGYTLIEGRCVYDQVQHNNYHIPYCQMAVNESYCSMCQNGFYSLQGICYQVSAYCLTYNHSTGACLTCKDTYVYSEGSCIFPALGMDPFCSQYAGVYCSRCEKGYYLKNYRCKELDPLCIDFNFQVSQCLVCRSGAPLFDVCK